MPTAENVLARLLVGVPVPSAEVDGLPEPGREIARRVIGANGNDPLAAFDKALTDCLPDAAARDAMRQAVFSFDPLADPNKLPLDLLTADTILKTKWPDPVYAIPKVLTAGLGILAGAPKIGKSWLGLQFAYGVAAGGRIFNEKVTQGPVLYLALEDPARRLQERMKKQGWPLGLPADFMPIGEYSKQIGDLRKGGADKLALQVKAGGYRLVVIDTLARAVTGDPLDAQEMTKGLTPLQETAHATNCAVLLIDHHRKASGFQADVIADILGSVAKGAMVDTALGLYRERGKAGAKLAIIGRELGERTLALTMDWLTGCWQCVGDADALELTERRQEILDCLQALGKATAKKIADAVNQDKGNTYRRLQDMVSAGLVKRDGEKYTLP